jgi:hypothetical protein
MAGQVQGQRSSFTCPPQAVHRAGVRDLPDEIQESWTYCAVLNLTAWWGVGQCQVDACSMAHDPVERLEGQLTGHAALL